jgi:hypothetical protein
VRKELYPPNKQERAVANVLKAQAEKAQEEQDRLDGKKHSPSSPKSKGRHDPLTGPATSSKGFNDAKKEKPSFSLTGIKKDDKPTASTTLTSADERKQASPLSRLVQDKADRRTGGLMAKLRGAVMGDKVEEEMRCSLYERMTLF